MPQWAFVERARFIMSVPGDRISLWLMLLIVLTAGGIAVTTIVYQDSAQDIREQNEALREENTELREKLNETERERRATNKRNTELESQLDARIEDVDRLSSELKEQDHEPNATRAQLKELQGTDSRRETVQLKRRLIVLCTIEENKDRFACDGIVKDG